MTVSSFFTGGWMDEPFGVTVLVQTSAGPRAQLRADLAFLAGMAPGSSFGALLAADLAFLAAIQGEPAALAAIQADAAVQAQVGAGSSFRATISCE
jgi:hypothetical protein